MAQEEGYTFLAQPAQLGCADSALSPAALLPMAVSGIEPLSVLEGAGQAYHDYDLRAFENPVWMYAGARHALELRTRRTELLGIFEPDCMHSAAGGPAARPGAAAAADTAFCPSRQSFPVRSTRSMPCWTAAAARLKPSWRIPLPARRRNIELDWKDYDDLGYLSGHSVGEAEGAMFDALVQTHASLDIPLIILSAGSWTRRSSASCSTSWS